MFVTELVSHPPMAPLNGLGLGAVPAKSCDMSSTRDTSHPAIAPCVASTAVRFATHSSTAACSCTFDSKTSGQPWNAAHDASHANSDHGPPSPCTASLQVSIVSM